MSDRGASARKYCPHCHAAVEGYDWPRHSCRGKREPWHPARRKINLKGSGFKAAGNAKAGSSDDSVAARVFRYIDAQEAEFGTAAVFGDVGNRLGVTYKAITSAIQSLRRKGMIRAVRHGWWEKTPRWSPSGSTPSTKEQQYATFRAGLNIQAPEIEGAAPTQH